MTDVYIPPRKMRNRAKEISDRDDVYSLVSYDPGGTTGWAVFAVNMDAMFSDKIKILSNIIFWSCGEIIGHELDQVSEMLALAQEWPDAQLLHEDFILMRASNSRDLLSPVRLTFGFEVGLREREDKRTVIKQQPSIALSTFSHDRLKELNFAQATHSDHERSAIAHALTWMRRKKKLLQSAVVTDMFMAERERGR